MSEEPSLALRASVRVAMTMTETERFLAEHAAVTRRDFLRLGIGSAAVAILPRNSFGDDKSDTGSAEEAPPPFARLDSYLTPPEGFNDISRGKPVPHSLPDEKKREVGLTRETWKLEVISDPDNPATLGKPLTTADGTALDFAALMRLAEKYAVRFRQGDDLPEHRLSAGHGHLGRRAAARGGLADQAEGEPAPSLLLRLPQRRSQADVSAVRCRSAGCWRTRSTCRR